MKTKELYWRQLTEFPEFAGDVWLTVWMEGEKIVVEGSYSKVFGFSTGDFTPRQMIAWMPKYTPDPFVETEKSKSMEELLIENSYSNHTMTDLLSEKEQLNDDMIRTYRLKATNSYNRYSKMLKELYKEIDSRNG